MILYFVTRYILGMIQVFFRNIDRGAIRLKSFEREWAWLTYRILRLLVTRLRSLHRSILDLFNEYEVAIMTPSYIADPPDPKLVPKQQWYAAPAVPPASVSSTRDDEARRRSVREVPASE